MGATCADRISALSIESAILFARLSSPLASGATTAAPTASLTRVHAWPGSSLHTLLVCALLPPPHPGCHRSCNIGCTGPADKALCTTEFYATRWWNCKRCAPGYRVVNNRVTNQGCTHGRKTGRCPGGKCFDPIPMCAENSLNGGSETGRFNTTGLFVTPTFDGTYMSKCVTVMVMMASVLRSLSLPFDVLMRCA